MSRPSRAVPSSEGFTSRRTRKSNTSCQLPGGRMADNRTTSSWPLFPLTELLTSPSATSRLGKNARNMLKATACETMPHCGDSCQGAEQFLRKRAKRHCPGLYRPRCILRIRGLKGLQPGRDSQWRKWLAPRSRVYAYIDSVRDERQRLDV